MPRALLEKPESLTDVLRDFALYESNSVRQNSEQKSDEMTNPELLDLIYRFQAAHQYESATHPGLRLDVKNKGISSLLLQSLKILYGVLNKRRIIPREFTHLNHTLRSVCNNASSIPLPPHIIPEFVQEYISDLLYQTLPPPESFYALSFDDLIRLQCRLRADDVRKKEDTTTLRAQLTDFVAPVNSSTTYSWESSESHTAFSDALDAFYLRTPYNEIRSEICSLLVTHEKSERLETLRRRALGKRMNRMKNVDLVAYMQSLDRERLASFLRIMQQTDLFLSEMGLKLTESDSLLPSDSETRRRVHHRSVIKQKEELITKENLSQKLREYKKKVSHTYQLVHKKSTVVHTPRGLTGKLRPFQLEGLRWLVSLYENNVNGILADMMGLGKTVQTIALLLYIKEKQTTVSRSDPKGDVPNPHLIIAPLNLIQQWYAELQEWAPALRVRVMESRDRTGILKKLQSPFSSLDLVANLTLQQIQSGTCPSQYHGLFSLHMACQGYPYADVVLLASNEISRRQSSHLENQQWDYIVVDEGHNAANPDSHFTIRLNRLRARHRLLLTGTPMKNRIDDLWNLLRFVNPNIFSGSSCSFSEMFETTVSGKNESLSIDERTILILRLQQIVRPFMLRRTHDDIGETLPQLHVARLICPLSLLQTYLYDQVGDGLEPVQLADSPTLRRCLNKAALQALIATHPEGHPFVEENVPGEGLAFLVRSSGKFAVLSQLVDALHQAERKAVFFAQRLKVVDLLERLLELKGHRFVTLRGDVPKELRRQIVEEFQKPEVPFFVASMKSGSHGIDGLQVANVGIFLDTDYTPSNDEQAQHRLCRFGQRSNHVHIIYLSTNTAIETRKFGIADQKRKGIANAVQTDRDYEMFGEPQVDPNQRDTLQKYTSCESEQTTPNDAEPSSLSSPTITRLSDLFPHDPFLTECIEKVQNSTTSSHRSKENEIHTLYTTWEDIPAQLRVKLETSKRVFEEEQSGEAVQNFGKGKRTCFWRDYEEDEIEETLPSRGKKSRT